MLRMSRHLDSALLHKEDVLHLIALVVDDALGQVHFLCNHMRQALNGVGRQVLELRHLLAL